MFFTVSIASPLPACENHGVCSLPLGLWSHTAAVLSRKFVPACTAPAAVPMSSHMLSSSALIWLYKIAKLQLVEVKMISVCIFNFELSEMYVYFSFFFFILLLILLQVSPFPPLHPAPIPPSFRPSPHCCLLSFSYSKSPFLFSEMHRPVFSCHWAGCCLWLWRLCPNGATEESQDRSTACTYKPHALVCGYFRLEEGGLLCNFWGCYF